MRVLREDSRPVCRGEIDLQDIRLSANPANVCDYGIGFESGLTIVHKHACAGMSKRQCGRSPNTAGRAGDKSSFTLECIHLRRGSQLR